MTIILNETAQAEKMIAEGNIGSKPSAALFLLGKYYRHKKMMNPQETAKKLHEFMAQHYKHYNPALWEEIIENISKKSAKYPLHELEYIGISQNELDCIRKLHNLKYETLVFVMLCYAKFYNTISENNHGWVNAAIPEIFRSARVTVKYRNDKFLFLNDIESNKLLGDVGLISFSNRNDNLNLRINFIDMEGEPVLRMDDFREPGYEYLNYCKEGNFVRCTICNRLVKRKSVKDHSTKYCADCKKTKTLEKYERYNKKRNLPPCENS